MGNIAPYLCEEAKNFRLKLGGDPATDAEAEWAKFREKVCNYTIRCPLGPFGPMLPVGIKDLHRELTKENSGSRKMEETEIIYLVPDAEIYE